jgi:hypothetical protein
MLRFKKSPQGHRVWVSPNYTVSGVLLTIPHSLPISNLRNVKVELGVVCTVANLGFAVGDIVFNPMYKPTGAAYWVALTPCISLTDIKAGISRDGVALWRKDTGIFTGITIGNWQIFARVTY